MYVLLFPLVKLLRSFAHLLLIVQKWLYALILWKGIHQGCILSPCLFNLHAEYIMRNAGLDEAQAGIRLPGEISVTSDMQMIPTLMAESKEELKSLLMKVKEESEKLA